MNRRGFLCAISAAPLASALPAALAHLTPAAGATDAPALLCDRFALVSARGDVPFEVHDGQTTLRAKDARSWEYRKDGRFITDDMVMSERIACLRGEESAER
ncbi:hypothetical protein [Stenotrophomonas bentonitica]|uniref:hypothetical protein n=1 Tax=Stenotrophomonas bentonitica TaxID=1450134 RepID=UPI00345EEAEE